MKLLKRRKYVDVPWHHTPKTARHVQLKADGHFAQIIPLDGKLLHFSRTERLVREIGLALRMPDTFSAPLASMRLFGEYLYGTQRAKQEVDGPYGLVLLYDLVDVADPWAVPYAERLNRLRQMFGANPDAFRHFMVVEDDVDYVEARARTEADNLEGLIFQDDAGAIFRQKRVEEEDYICVGFLPFKTGPRKGQGCGSIIGGKLDADGNVVPVTTMSGIDDRFRQEMLAAPEMFVGRVFTACGKGRFDSGLLRHPNFSRWRDDKSADDCALMENER